MRLNDLIEELIRQKPGTIKTKQDAVKYIFLTTDNLLRWNGEGEVENLNKSAHWQKSDEYAAAKTLPPQIREALRPSIRARIRANLIVLRDLENELEKPVESLTGDVLMDERSLSWIIPGNITEEYADAFRELTKDAHIVFNDD